MSAPVPADLPRHPVDLTESALFYAEQGLRIFPCRYPIFDQDTSTLQGCSCGDPGCKNQGKHPAIKDWPNRATSDPDRIRAYWSKNPFANIGLLCGEGNGFDVLDVDPKDDGPAALQEYVECYGPIPQTLSSHTGSGGQHLLFRHTPNLKNNNHGKIGRGLDFRADGGQIIAPPSLHFSGNRYLWENESQIAPPPIWLVELMRTDGDSAKPRASLTVEEWKAVAAGAAPGGRHNTILQLAGLLCGGSPIRSKHLAAALVHAYNRTFCDPPKSDDEINGIIRYVLNRQRKEDFG